MKKQILTVITLTILNATASFGQKDTIFTTITQETGTLEPQHFMSEDERAFGVMTPARWMFKWDLANTIANVVNNPGANIGAETKITSGVSIGMNIQYSRETLMENFGFTFVNPKTRFSTTARWYYNMAKNIKKGKSASNFSGNYLAIESAAEIIKRNGQVSNVYDVSLKFGMQRRLLKFGYFDMSYALGEKYMQYGKGGNRAFTLQPHTAIGLALFNPSKSAMAYGTACDMFKCYEESRRMLKVDLYNLLQVAQISKRYTSAWANPWIALEQKIGTSPFSTEVGASGRADYFAAYPYVGSDAPSIVARQIGATGTAELRWYYSQKKRILEGKSGNNLSGLFVAVNTAYSAYKSYFFQASDYRSIAHRTDIRTVFGIQHRILDHGFVQFKIGPGLSWAKNVTTLDDGTVEIYKPGVKLKLFSELKAGFTF